MQEEDEFTPFEPKDSNISPKNVADWIYHSRGRGVSMWAWLLHRLTAVISLFVVVLHILRNQFGILTPGGRLVSIDLLVFSLTYHTLNGARVIIVETWGLAAEKADTLFWVVIGLTLVTISAWLIVVGL